MSLLNDALKKKQREEQGPAGFPGGGSRPSVPSRARLYTLLGVAALVAAGVAFMLVYSPDSEPPARRIRQVDTTPAPSAPAPPATVVAVPATPPPAVTAVPVAAAPPASKTVAKATPPRLSPPRTAVVASPGAEESSAAAPVTSPPMTSTSTSDAPLTPVATVAPPGQVKESDELDPALQPYYEKAQSYQKQKRYNEAATFYRQILQQAPRHQDSRRHLLTCLLESGRYREAYDLALPLSRELPDDAIAWLNLAIAEIGISENRQALLHLQEAERRNGPRFEIFLNRGVAASRLGEWDQAFAAYHAAEAVSPGGSALLFNLGLASDKTGKLADAAGYYEAFLKSATPDHPQRQQVAERLQAIRRYLGAQLPTTRS